MDIVETYRRDLHLRSRRGMLKGTEKTLLKAVDHVPSATLDAPDEQVMVWSDLHLGHANIIKYVNRPFADVHAMDRHLWERWESRVQPEDTLVVVGDVAMRRALNEETFTRVREAPGRPKHLVIGNHDLTGQGRLRVGGFDHAWCAMTSPGDPLLVWTHIPLSVVPPGAVNVHGHLHDTPPTRTRHINVCVEHLDYEPICLRRLRRLAKALAMDVHPAGETTIERVRSLESDDRRQDRHQRAV